MNNVEMTGRTTFYSVDIDEKNYTVEVQFDANSGSYVHTIYFNDEVTGGQEEVTDAEEREIILNAIFDEYEHILEEQLRTNIKYYLQKFI